MARGIASGATKLVVLVVVGLQLVCLQQPNGVNAQRAECQWTKTVPKEIMKYCCNPIDKDVGGRGGKPPTPQITAAQKRQLDDTKLGVECVHKFFEMAKNPSKPLEFPMECCQVPMFKQFCRTTSYNRKFMNRMLQKSRLVVNKEKEQCSPKIAEQCCPWNIQKLPRNSVSTAPRTFVELIKCAMAMISNLVQGKFVIPDSCCKLPVFNLFCGNKPPTPRPGPVPRPTQPGPGPGPGPGPRPPPPTRKTSPPRPPQRLRSWEPLSDFDY